MNYYDHEIKVKIIDAILSHSQDWDWFVEYTEDNFSPNIEISSFNDATNAFREVVEPLNFLCRIREYCNNTFSFKTDWLRELDQLALFYVGKLEANNINIQSEFSKIALIQIYSGKLYNQTYQKKLLTYSRIFEIRNLFNLENLELFIDEEETFVRLFERIDIDISKQKQIFEDNINRVFYPANSKFVTRHLSDFYSANCFAFNNINDENLRTWEEEELLKMLSVSFSNGQIIPIYSSGETHFPEYEIWTEAVLNHIKEYYDSEVVDFVIESICYALYSKMPSEKSINKHFELLYELSISINKENLHELDCSSLHFAIEFINSFSHHIANDSFSKYSTVLNVLFENKYYHLLFEIKDKNALCNKKIQKELNRIIDTRLSDIDKISDFTEFNGFIHDKRIIKRVQTYHFEKLSLKFDDILKNERSITIATLFLDYFLFLLKIKNNSNIVTADISSEIIRIRTLWQEEYFIKVEQGLNTIEAGSFSIPKELSKNYAYSIMRNPYKFALNTMKLKENQLIECMSEVAETPMLLYITRIAICEDFPQKPFLKVDEKHPIDEFFLKEIENERDKKSYKLLNNFDSIKFISGIYERIKSELKINMTILNDIEPLYDAVKCQNPQYSFIDFSPVPKLAHVTQLFPLLENRIRELGELFSIVPVCENEDLCHRLKEPDTVLRSIISAVYEMDGSLAIVADLFFVHFCMFSENGLNIRNDCIHGNGYFKESEILFAFKLTLISLYIIGARYDTIIENLKTDANNYA